MKSAVAFFSALILITGATFYHKLTGPPFDSDNFLIFNTFCEIKISGGGAVEVREARSRMEQALAPFSLDTKEGIPSELTILNRDKILKNPSPHFLRCLTLARDFFEKTGGWFDPSIYTLMDAYGFYDGKHRLPSDLELNRIISENTHLKLMLSSREISIDPSQSLDLGAIVKGYAIDSAVEYLSNQNLNGFLINFGGEVAAFGKNGDRAWRVGLRDPSGNGIIGDFALDRIISTSGDYNNRFEVEGRVIIHIFSPFSGRNDSDLKSVSVFSRSGAEADALSTALFAMGSEEAGKFAVKSGIPVILINSAGEIQRIGNAPEILQNK
ncbi:MAG: FAD:protein FMN transferase [Candidatus Wallbacteria bacterium]|nr:FAD:protein FMN transferase [Candidatus Wallbacteria bacterium]